MTVSRQRFVSPGRTVGLLLAGAALWLVLTGGDLRSPGLAGASVLVAVIAASRLGTGTGWSSRFVGVVQFVPFFAYASVAGAFDVIVRAFAPGPRLSPDFIVHRPRLEPTTVPGTFFIALVSLLPGTLSADIDGTRVIVHVVDRGRANHATLVRLEQRVAALFGRPLQQERARS